MNNPFKRVFSFYFLASMLLNANAFAQNENDLDAIPDIEAIDVNSHERVPANNTTPKWSFEFKVGEFEPALDGWATYFGEDTTSTFGVSLGYKIWRQLEVGVGIDMIRDSGQGFLPLNNLPGGSVKYKLYPANVYVLYRGVFHEDQLIVPYIGAGITRATYKQEIRNQPGSEGDTDGTHWRGGIQILLDFLDEGGSSAIREDAGVDNTYLTIEASHFEADVDGTELGGDSITIGMVFEF